MSLREKTVKPISSRYTSSLPLGKWGDRLASVLTVRGAFKHCLQDLSYKSELIHYLRHPNCHGSQLNLFRDSSAGSRAHLRKSCCVWWWRGLSAASPVQQPAGKASTWDRCAARGPPAASKTEVLIKSYNITSISLLCNSLYTSPSSQENLTYRNIY